MSKTAREFLDQIADALRAKGREVEVTEETTPSGSDFVWLYSPAPRGTGTLLDLHTRTISLSAARTNAKGSRWALGELRVGSTPWGKEFTAKTRSDIRISVDVYA